MTGYDDYDGARELALYIKNDYTIYNSVILALYKNYAAKRAKGTFDKAKAVKGCLIVVRRGIEAYNKEFGGMRLSKHDKELLAADIFGMLWDELGLKNVRKCTPKKKGSKK